MILALFDKNSSPNLTFVILSPYQLSMQIVASSFICGDSLQSAIRSSGFAKLSELFKDEGSSKKGVYSVEFGKEDVIRDKIITYLVEKIELLAPKH